MRPDAPGCSKIKTQERPRPSSSRFIVYCSMGRPEREDRGIVLKGGGPAPAAAKIHGTLCV